MPYFPPGYFTDQEDSSGDDFSTPLFQLASGSGLNKNAKKRRNKKTKLRHEASLDPVYSALKERFENVALLMQKPNGLDFVTHDQIKAARLDEENPLRFVDEVSGRVRGGIIDWLDETHLLKMTDIERQQIQTWYLPTLPTKPNNQPAFNTIIEYNTKDLKMLMKFASCDVLGVDLEFSCTTPRVPVIIQLTSWQFGTLIIHVDVLHRDDKRLLKQIFHDPSVLKIGFGFRNDVAALKLFGIHPSAFIDLQLIIEKQLDLNHPPGLALCANVLIGEVIDKELRVNLFERRVNGSLPEDLKLYAARDSIMHLCCFYSFVKESCMGGDGNQDGEREQELLNKINKYYQEIMVNILINFEPKLTPSDEELENHAFWAQEYQERLQILQPDERNVAVRLNMYRQKMHKHCGLLSPYDLLPNGLLFHFALRKPLFPNTARDTINSWREENKSPRTKEQLKKGMTGFNVWTSGPLHATVEKNFFAMYQIIWGLKTVEELVSRVCKRCRLNSCIAFSSCEGNRAIQGHALAVAKATKYNLPSVRSAYSPGAIKSFNRRAARRLMKRGLMYDHASGQVVPIPPSGQSGAKQETIEAKLAKININHGQNDDFVPSGSSKEPTPGPSSRA